MEAAIRDRINKRLKKLEAAVTPGTDLDEVTTLELLGVLMRKAYDLEPADPASVLQREEVMRKIREVTQRLKLRPPSPSVRELPAEQALKELVKRLRERIAREVRGA